MLDYFSDRMIAHRFAAGAFAAINNLADDRPFFQSV
jgi:hypothetical protein